MPAGLKLARVAYVTFAVAVLLALLKLNDVSGAKPFILKIVPATPVAKAAQTAAGDCKVPRDEALDLTDADARETIGSRTSNLPGRKDSARTKKAASDEAPVFYRPSSGEDVDGESVCGNLGDFLENSRVIFPLPRYYFGSYEDTWGRRVRRVVTRAPTSWALPGPRRSRSPTGPSSR